MRYLVERTNKAEIKPEEQSQKTESCRESLWNGKQSKGPYRQKWARAQHKKEGWWRGAEGREERMKAINTKTLFARDERGEVVSGSLNFLEINFKAVHNLFSCRVSMRRRSHDLPRLNEFSGVVLSCFTLSRQTS